MPKSPNERKFAQSGHPGFDLTGHTVHGMVDIFFEETRMAFFQQNIREQMKM
jgi:hypothetical protein